MHFKQFDDERAWGTFEIPMHSVDLAEDLGGEIEPNDNDDLRTTHRSELTTKDKSIVPVSSAHEAKNIIAKEERKSKTLVESSKVIIDDDLSFADSRDGPLIRQDH